VSATATPLDRLVELGALSAEALAAAKADAARRGLRLERVLVQDLGLPRQVLIDAVALHFGCPAIGFDERVPVPTELLGPLDRARAAALRCAPLLTDGHTTVVVAADPRDERLPAFLDALAAGLAERTGEAGREHRFEVWAALEEDVAWYLQDYAHAPLGKLIGTERTALAYWRNIMAHWRTRMACFRTDFAKLRTTLAVARFGLGMVALADGLWRSGRVSGPALPGAMMAAGLGLAAASAPRFWALRRTLRPPGHHGLVEITAATVHFIEGYTPVKPADGPPPLPHRTMLARLGQRLAELLTTLDPPPTQKERAPLARERTILAGLRTVGACTRTLYARARTGLAFIRTGVSLAGLGLGLLGAFPSGPLSVVDGALVGLGLLFAVDGVAWYWPARREESAAEVGGV
jgi:uncharacterized membrane protein YidH (DUF202 family)